MAKRSLFPAYAGVILALTSLKVIMFTFPRICGGDPFMVCYVENSAHFSPHMRG